MTISIESHERLQEIRQEMMELLEEAKTIVRHSDKHIYERAKAYWIGHIDTALGGGAYIDTYDYTLEKTIDELTPDEEDEEDNDDGEQEDSQVSAPDR
jgi:hypothetical protein